MLNPETRKRVDLLFEAAEREEVADLLDRQCGNNLPFLEGLDEYQLERFRFAALKISNGSIPKLIRAVESAQLDWRDLLMAAGFGYDIHAHETWLPQPSEDALKGADNHEHTNRHL